eukprot:12690527-Prorocentrum_lima.AAC.1
MLRTWRTALKRGQEVGIPALGGNERFIRLVKMISKLEKKHPQFCHRAGIVKYSREARTPYPGNCKTVGRGDNGRIENAGSR